MKVLIRTAALAAMAMLVSVGVVSSELGTEKQKHLLRSQYAVTQTVSATQSDWVNVPTDNIASRRQMREFAARNHSISIEVDKLLQKRLEQKYASVGTSDDTLAWR